jgi:hypothetical protein
MGPQQSKSVDMATIVNESVTDVFMSNSQSCTQSNVQTQTMILEGIDTSGTNCGIDISNVTQASLQSPNLSCISNNANSTDIMTKLTDTIDQKAKAAVSGASGSVYSKSDAENIANVTNTIKTKIDISTASTCIQNNFNSQDMILKNFKSGCPACCGNMNGIPKNCDCKLKVSKIHQTALQTASANCITNNTAVAKAIADANANFKQASTANNSGIGSAATGSSVSGCASVLICVAFIAIVAVMMMLPI